MKSSFYFLPYMVAKYPLIARSSALFEVDYACEKGGCSVAVYSFLLLLPLFVGILFLVLVLLCSTLCPF